MSVIILNKDCKHESIKVNYDSDVAKNLTSYEVKKLYPRFQGACPECGQHLIKYASAEHYIAGDW
jgi:hypothetical protein